MGRDLEGWELGAWHLGAWHLGGWHLRRLAGDLTRLAGGGAYLYPPAEYAAPCDRLFPRPLRSVS